jgi:hypothetical protein
VIVSAGFLFFAAAPLGWNFSGIRSLIKKTGFLVQGAGYENEPSAFVPVFFSYLFFSVTPSPRNSPRPLPSKKTTLPPKSPVL